MIDIIKTMTKQDKLILVAEFMNIEWCDCEDCTFEYGTNDCMYGLNTITRISENKYDPSSDWNQIMPIYQKLCGMAFERMFVRNMVNETLPKCMRENDIAHCFECICIVLTILKRDSENTINY